MAGTIDFESHYQPTYGPQFLRTTIALLVVAALLSGHRCYHTYVRRGFLGVEDAMVAMGLLFLTAAGTIACESFLHGFGYHTDDIELVGGDLTKALQLFWTFQILYKIAICFNKLAFLTLYLSLFPATNVRNICWASIAIVALGSVAFVATTTMECLPVEKNWHRDAPGHCINNTAFRWSWAAFNTITDLWIVMLPLPIILKLQMSLLKRAGTAFMFLLGLFIVAASCLRMSALVKSVHATSDITWDSAPAFLWSQVEASVGLIAICLPALKSPLAKLLPRNWGGSTITHRGGTSDIAKGHQLQSFHTARSQRLAGVSRNYEGDEVTNIIGKGADVEDEGQGSEDEILAAPGIVIKRDFTVQSEPFRSADGEDVWRSRHNR